MARSRFYEVLTAAVADFTRYGFDSAERLEYWLQVLRTAIGESLAPEHVLERQLRDSLARLYQRTVAGGQLARAHPDVSRFTLERLKPKLRTELDRRILASASLIRLNRAASIQKTLQRFSGWASAIPAGGSRAVDKPDTKDGIRRGIAGLPFEERRVITDQGHKLVAAINEIVAKDGGAIALIWRHVKEGPPAYDARPEHVARNGKLYVLRDNWALKDGLMKLAGHAYYDEVSAVGQEPYCRCFAVYIHSLRGLPPEMLTEKGRHALERARHAA